VLRNAPNLAVTDNFFTVLRFYMDFMNSKADEILYHRVAMMTDKKCRMIAIIMKTDFARRSDAAVSFFFNV
jgi:hypothetical protein